MEKIKLIIAGLLKYHFWVLLGIVVVIALFTWNSAIGRLDEEFTKQKSQIDSHFSQIESLSGEMIQLESGESRFANKKWQEETLERAKVLRSEVKRAWEAVYLKQKNTRKWPDLNEEVSGELLGQAIESKSPETPIPAGDLLEPYKEVLAKQVEELPSLVSAAPIPDFDPKARTPRKTSDTPMASLMNDTGGVRWNAENFQAIRKRFEVPRAPTTGWALQAQEDLWVYQMLLSAIEKCNGEKGPRDEFNLPINRIEFIDLGIQVSRKMDIGRKVDAVASVKPMVPEAGEAAFNLAEPGSGQAGKKEEEKKEFGRYVQGERSPTGFSSLPVRMRLQMKLEKLPMLMMELVNNDLTTEIVDIYVEDPRGLGGQESSPTAANRTVAYGSDFGEEYGIRSGLDQANMELGGLSSNNPSVEIWALVHFANRPDDRALMSPAEVEELAKQEKAAAEKSNQKKTKSGKDEDKEGEQE